MVSSFKRVRDYIAKVKDSMKLSGIARIPLIADARKLHKIMTEDELRSLAVEMEQFNAAEIRMAIGIGLREPTRSLISKVILSKKVTL